MKTITTRMVENADEEAAVYRLRYDYYVGWCEINVRHADHERLALRDERDARALQFATFAGHDVVGGFRIEVGAPDSLRFGADWHCGDFLDAVPVKIGLVSWLVADPHLRDTTVLSHMARESVGLAGDLELDHVFFECCPAHWPLFHLAGLKRKGGALRHRITGLNSAVFHLDRSDRHVAALAAREFGAPVVVKSGRVVGEAGDRAAHLAVRRRSAGLVSGGN
ncbi:MAG: hypothetical protein P4L82_00510 [Ancalomicrobiaceae bacterium]|nr:hypothetical protein [Ancalomicrobiaceae bacterium]